MRFAAAVLAGGAGRRFGADKLLQPLGGRPLVDHAMASAAAAPVERLYVAAGSSAIEAAVSHGPSGRDPRLSIIRVHTIDEGIAASIRAVAAVLDPGLDGLFIFLGDMPLIPPGIAHRLAAELSPGIPAVAPVYSGRRGHPVLIGKELLPGLCLLDGDRGAASLVQKAAFIVVDDMGVTFDVDTPADLAAAGKRIGIGPVASGR